MTRRTLAVAALFVVSAIFSVSAAPTKGTATNTFYQANLSLTGFGVSDDGDPAYLNGAGGVQSYLGAGGNNVNLVTYGTGRKLHFVFDPASPAWRASGLPQNFMAEVTSYGDFIGCKGEQGAKEAGKLRLEGKDYVVRDGDVIHFRFNV